MMQRLADSPQVESGQLMSGARLAIQGLAALPSALFASFMSIHTTACCFNCCRWCGCTARAWWGSSWWWPWN